MTPEQIQMLVMQTLQQTLSSPDPSPQPFEEPPQMEAMEQELPPSGGFSLPEQMPPEAGPQGF
jgi:hypothetical protein